MGQIRQPSQPRTHRPSLALHQRPLHRLPHGRRRSRLSAGRARQHQKRRHRPHPNHPQQPQTRLRPLGGTHRRGTRRFAEPRRLRPAVLRRHHARRQQIRYQQRPGHPPHPQPGRQTRLLPARPDSRTRQRKRLPRILEHLPPPARRRTPQLPARTPRPTHPAGRTPIQRRVLHPAQSRGKSL